WDRRDRLTFRSIQTAEAGGDLDAMDPAARYASWHVVEPGGRIWSAGAAIPRVMRRLPGGRPVATLTATFPAVTERMYGLVVRHRTRLGRMLGQRACSVDPSAIRGGREP
ncbi:MAG TPA: DCC1-like thiol-disulfide oxidoreductase family protein, partial [Microbacterium sp.]|nr:DCC1-like thiol-disulfide oxidoreductase family protein [Microbacterium sp.]